VILSFVRNWCNMNPGYEITIMTLDNYHDYISLPDLGQVRGGPLPDLGQVRGGPLPSLRQVREIKWGKCAEAKGKLTSVWQTE
jgi:hypothetical protein